MGGFSECLETRIRQLWHYNTTFGSIGFNILAIQLNVLQLIITAVLLGVWHSYVTIEYIWWPAFECLRIFVLTLCRADVLLKDINEIRHNSRGSSQTRKIIMLCNLIGATSMIIGAPIYLLLLPKYTSLMYWMFIITYLILILSRIALTIPMFSALIYGISMYRIIDGNDYQRIADERQQYATDPLLAADDGNGLDHSGDYHIPDDVRMVLEEDHQLRRAIEASRRERDRSIREQQDREYQEALEQQRKIDEAERMSGNPLLDDNDLLTTDITTQTINNDNNIDTGLVTNGFEMNRSNSSISSASPMSGSSSRSLQSLQIDDAAMEKEKELEREEVIKELLAALPEIGEEPAKTKDTVSVRVRLPNGKRCMRRFNKTSSIGDIKNWVNHELVLNESEELINEFDLVTTMPRTIYNNLTKTLIDLKFWRQNSKRECHTPLLYVEENLIHNDSENDDDDSSEQ